MVTLTVGGNDLDIVEIAAICTSATPPPQECSEAIVAAGTLLQSGALAASLNDTYAQVAAAAPKARVVVTGYPLLFAAWADPLTTQLNEATIVLNETIESVVAQATRLKSSIQYVDVSDDFSDHGIDSAAPWINSMGPDAFHPNAAGYQAYAAAIQAALAR